MHHKTLDSKYNTANVDSEADHFIPQFNLLQGGFEGKDKLAVPTGKTRLRRGSKVELKNKKPTINTTNITKTYTNSIKIAGDDLNNSDYETRFKYDINEKPQLEDKRAQQMLVN